MTTVNMESILSKAKKYTNTPQFQDKVRKKVDSIILSNGSTGMSGGSKISIGGLRMAAEKFIEVLKNEISNSNIAISDVISLEYDTPKKVGINRYQIEIWFSNDLHRESLAPDKYDGIDNVVALFNNGYTAHNAVHGTWHGQEIYSLTNRAGIHFIDSAIRSYMANYASEYGVVSIETSPTYK